MRACVNAATAVPPSATQFVVGFVVMPQQIPRAVSAAPPFAVTVAPSVAVVAPILADVGVVSVGTTTVVVKELSAE